MSITITINCDNAAFEGEDCGPEIARILRKLAAKVAINVGDGCKLHDSNGNSVGRFDVQD